MDEGLLHKLSEDLGGRFKLTSLVQKRLVEMMLQRHDVVTKHSGGRPIRLVIEEVAREHLGLGAPAAGEGPPAQPREGQAADAGKK